MTGVDMTVWIVLTVLIVLVFALWTVVLVTNARDRRRLLKAEEAGTAAALGYQEEMLAARTRGIMRFRTTLIRELDGTWRSLLWDARPVDASQVEGHLVPFYIATGVSREETEKDMADFVSQWAARVAHAHGTSDFQVVQAEFINRAEA